MHRFSYLRPKSIDEAISLMESHGERAAYIAGGTDILVKIKERKVWPDLLISLRHIPELAYIRYEEATGILRIGSMTTHGMLEKSPLIRRRYPIFSDAVDNIGSVQIRNVATIRGNIVNAVPSADGAIPLITLGAQIRMGGPKGKRTMDLVDFFIGPGADPVGTWGDRFGARYSQVVPPHGNGVLQAYSTCCHGASHSGCSITHLLRG